MTLYQIIATIVHHTTDKHAVSCDKTIGIPTFYLDANVQGIVDEKHAEKIAREIILPVELQYESVTINLHVLKITTPER